MTRHNFLTLILILIAFLALGSLLASPSNTRANVFPTPAPTATGSPVDQAGNTNPVLEPTTAPLVEPLMTSQQALAMALAYDKDWATWEQAWTKDTLSIDSERVKIEAFPSRSAESAAHGYNELFAPELDKAAGQVWSITLTGPVHLIMLTSNAGDPDRLYDGVTYVISQRTGQLLAMRAGKTIKSSVP